MFDKSLTILVWRRQSTSVHAQQCNTRYTNTDIAKSAAYCLPPLTRLLCLYSGVLRIHWNHFNHLSIIITISCYSPRQVSLSRMSEIIACIQCILYNVYPRLHYTVDYPLSCFVFLYTGHISQNLYNSYKSWQRSLLRKLHDKRTFFLKIRLSLSISMSGTRREHPKETALFWLTSLF